MVADRIRAIRDRIQRREKSTRAGRRARSRRIEREEPASVGEKAQVKARQTKRGAEMTADEARGLAADAKELVSTEFGVSEGEAEGIISQGAGLLDDLGERVEQLDIDGDGDTDLLEGLEAVEPGDGGSAGVQEPLEASESGGGVGISDPAEPVFDPFEEDDDLF